MSEVFPSVFLGVASHFLKQELILKQNTTVRLLEISSSQCEEVNYSEERGKKTIDIAKESYWLQIQKFRRSTYKLYSEFLKHMQSTETRKKIRHTHNPKNKPLQNGKKVIVIGD